MALNKHSASGSRSKPKVGSGADHSPDGQEPVAPQNHGHWINGSWVATQQTVDWLNQLQRTLLQAVVAWNETLASAMAEPSAGLGQGAGRLVEDHQGRC